MNESLLSSLFIFSFNYSRKRLPLLFTYSQLFPIAVSGWGGGRFLGCRCRGAVSKRLGDFLGILAQAGRGIGSSTKGASRTIGPHGNRCLGSCHQRTEPRLLGELRDPLR